MIDARLKAGLLVQAILRLYDREMIPVALRRRGDPDAGAVLVKIALDREKSVLMSQVRDIEGRAAWLRTGPDADAAIEAAIAKAITRDPDLWVIEAEDPRGRLPFEAPILR